MISEKALASAAASRRTPDLTPWVNGLAPSVNVTGGLIAIWQARGEVCLSSLEAQMLKFQRVISLACRFLTISVMTCARLVAPRRCGHVSS
jgi:hypothetical protein